MLGTTLGILLGALVALPQEAAPPAVSPETAARFAKSLQKLGSDDFQDRDEGSREIASLPSETLGLVQAALKGSSLDIEVRSRLEALVPRLKSKARKEAAARRRVADLAWTRKTVLDPFNRTEWKDAAWAPKAREALEIMILIWGSPDPADRGQALRARTLTQEAIQAGCGDPLVLYADARLYDMVVRKDYLEAFRLHLHAANRMRDIGGMYPPIRQANVFGRAAEYHARYRNQPTEEDRKASQVWLDLGMARFAEALKDPELPEVAILESAGILIGASTILTHDRKIGFDRVFAVLQPARPDSTLPLLLKGEFYTSFAWDARGNGTADTVTPDGWKVMKERLAEAETVLTKAWEKAPDDPKAPTAMLTVELGQAKGREVLEAWYKRAMDTDPDNLEACKKKMYYLEPKWHGNREEMLAFGRKLLEGGNWEARLPFVLVDAHQTLAGYQRDKAAYYRTEAVWKDIQGVYASFLKEHPEGAFERTTYAKLAGWCDQYEEANRQFDILGERAVPAVFGGPEALNRAKTEAIEKTR